MAFNVLERHQDTSCSGDVGSSAEEAASFGKLDLKIDQYGKLDLQYAFLHAHKSQARDLAENRRQDILKCFAFWA